MIVPTTIDRDEVGKEEYKSLWGRRKKERALVGENIWKQMRP
jgi:hypothetical protein